ncbi:MAG TPA: DUF4350 domain-containing protein [Anaerolineae bacterium]|nr:DUF4350 domain-containing protein [Anaerolineae bacterium]
MKRLSRDAWLGGGVIALLLLVTAVGAIYQARQQVSAQSRPLTVASTAPEGARALWLWLEALDYPVSAAITETFALPPQTGVVLVLEPSQAVTEEVWETLTPWLEQGGTLIVAGERYGAQTVLDHFDFELHYFDTPVVTLTAQTPLWFSPPLTMPVPLKTRAYFTTDRADFTTHFAVGDKPVLVSFQEQRGRVFLCATPYPFSNAGLKHPGNAALVLNLLVGRPDGSVWFDEWHHGARVLVRAGPETWLRTTAVGHALLYSAGVIFVALLLHGQNFGRPFVPPQLRYRRAPIEYITAIANLHRRAGHRADALRTYHRQLKRALGQRYRLDPDLPDPEYVALLESYIPTLDAPALRDLLRNLRRSDVSEREMLQLVHAAVEQMKTYGLKAGQ